MTVIPVVVLNAKEPGITVRAQRKQEVCRVIVQTTRTASALGYRGGMLPTWICSCKADKILRMLIITARPVLKIA